MKEARTILEKALSEFGDDCLVTTALGAGGVLLLAWMQEIDPKYPAYFVDTGRLFTTTLVYRDYLKAKFEFNIVTVPPAMTKEEMAKLHGPDLNATNPDLCCKILKVAPVQKLLKGKKVWVSAPRREQGGNRAYLEHTRVDDSGITRIYPLAHITRVQIDEELGARGIMQHPLRACGYESIGCEPCTSPAIEGERSGRWTGQCKTECGLHFDNKKA